MTTYNKEKSFPLTSIAIISSVPISFLIRVYGTPINSSTIFIISISNPGWGPAMNAKSVNIRSHDNILKPIHAYPDNEKEYNWWALSVHIIASGRRRKPKSWTLTSEIETFFVESDAVACVCEGNEAQRPHLSHRRGTSRMKWGKSEKGRPWHFFYLSSDEFPSSLTPRHNFTTFLSIANAFSEHVTYLSNPYRSRSSITENVAHASAVRISCYWNQLGLGFIFQFCWVFRMKTVSDRLGGGDRPKVGAPRAFLALSLLMYLLSSPSNDTAQRVTPLFIFPAVKLWKCDAIRFKKKKCS